MPIKTIERMKATHEAPLDEVKSEFYEVCGIIDEKFMEEGYDLKNIHPSDYWLSVAIAGREMASEQYGTIDTLSNRGSALELVAATPYYLLAQQQLNNARSTNPASGVLSSKEAYNKRYYVSHYNGLIRSYALTHSDTTTPELNASLTAVIEMSEITKYPEAFRRMMAETIRGAQHEVAGEQVLSQIMDIRPSSTEEDLQGIDLVGRLPDAHSGVPIDIKASPKSILEAYRSTNDIVAISNGRMLVCPHLTDDELQGKFMIDERTATRQASILRPLILSCAQNATLKRIQF